MAYVGAVGDKVTVEVTLVGEFNFETTIGWMTQHCTIYSFEDGDGNKLIWKTSSVLKTKEDKNGDCYYIQKNDKVKIAGTIKEHSTYKGEEQTVLQRVKVSEVIKKALTYEDKKSLRQNEQLQSLKGQDFIWEMPYKQYKDHYSDCETLYGSYDDHSREAGYGQYIPASIKVIIREGRLKNSGVRGKHFLGFELEDVKTKERISYRAVSEENALRRARKEFPDNEWSVIKVY